MYFVPDFCHCPFFHICIVFFICIAFLKFLHNASCLTSSLVSFYLHSYVYIFSRHMKYPIMNLYTCFHITTSLFLYHFCLSVSLYLSSILLVNKYPSFESKIFKCSLVGPLTIHPLHPSLSFSSPFPHPPIHSSLHSLCTSSGSPTF